MELVLRIRTTRNDTIVTREVVFRQELKEKKFDLSGVKKIEFSLSVDGETVMICRYTGLFSGVYAIQKDYFASYELDRVDVLNHDSEIIGVECDYGNQELLKVVQEDEHGLSLLVFFSPKFDESEAVMEGVCLCIDV